MEERVNFSKVLNALKTSAAQNAAQDEAHSLKDDAALLLESGFVRRIDRCDDHFFVKQKDIREWRYPLHYIRRLHVENRRQYGDERSWIVLWERYAYDLYRVQKESYRLQIPSGMGALSERSECTPWLVETPPLLIGEVISFYQILSETRHLP